MSKPSLLAQQIRAAAAHSSSIASPTNAEVLRWRRMAEKGWEAHTKQAIDKYRAVMYEQGWLTAWEIECRLGYSRTSSATFIRKLFDANLIERRNKNGADKYCRRSGYQYRWNEAAYARENSV